MKKIFTLFFTVIFLPVSLVFSENTPQRIISLSPLITEEIYMLGEEGKLVGNTVYCNRPLEAVKIEKVGTLIRANVEKIVSLKPDMVLAITLTSEAQVKQLRNLGLEVKVFPNPRTFNEVCDNFVALGAVLGKEGEAKKLADSVLSDINVIREEIGKLEKKKVFIQIGSEPLFAATGDNFVNDFIDSSGGINIAYGKNGASYSREAVVKEDPDIIIIAEMGITGAKEKVIWERFKSMKAVKNNKIFVVESYKYCSPTPDSLPETLRETVRMVHS